MILRTIVQSALLTVGLVGIAWSATVLPIVQSAGFVREATVRIMADERFKDGVAASLLERMQAELPRTILPPEMARARGLFNLLVAEEATQRRSSDEADRRMLGAEVDLGLSLEVAPIDSFLWLMLYLVSTGRNGLDEKYVRYLEQSYSTGPYEGWIALRRNRFALSALQMLSAEMQKSVITEFVRMVDSRFLEVAAANLEGAGWPHRERMLEGLGQADIMSRELFVRRLARDGVKVAVPGVKGEERPW